MANGGGDDIVRAFDSVMDSGYRGVQRPDESAQRYLANHPEFQDQLAQSLGATEKRVKNATTGGEKGQKDAQFSLLPWDVLGKLAEHYAKGAKKYSRNNWRKGYDWSLSIDALGRHLAAFVEGETYDPETGSHHMLAVMFHAASLVYFTDAHPELDDRRNSVAHNPTE